jgi:hypothetical protein
MSGKKIISLSLLYALVFMIISGIVLFIMPHGRVAYWTGWTFLSLNKDQWQALHTISGFIMVITGIFHLYFNWKPMKSYLVSKLSSKISTEFLLVSLLAIVISVMTIMQLPPFQSFMDFGDGVKARWEKNIIEAPMPHFEDLSLSQIAKKSGVDVQNILTRLSQKRVIANADDVLKELAAKHELVPSELYSLFRDVVTTTTLKSEAEAPKAGSGLGRKSLAQVCETLGHTQQECAENLKQHGIKADFEKSLKDIATEHDLLPNELYKML